ncbi:bcl-2-interacting killer isoform X2 [Channa argus]|uniref:bcl-2-interacting killer isoform X2 n=1 Tax=Channa argus TaxID=215402 RepID=UPI00351FB828
MFYVQRRVFPHGNTAWRAPSAAAGKGVVSRICGSYLQTTRLKDAAGGVRFNLHKRKKRMVEQTRAQSPVVSLQAGPGEVDTGPLLDVNLRISNRAARAVGRQLAVIGDQLDQEWPSRQPHWLATPLHMLRPAQALTRTIYRDIHSQVWGFQSLSAAVKAWTVSTAPAKGNLRAEAWAAWVSKLKAVTCTGWTRGALVTVALVAAVTILSALWMEWKA